MSPTFTLFFSMIGHYDICNLSFQNSKRELCVDCHREQLQKSGCITIVSVESEESSLKIIFPEKSQVH